MIDIGDQAPDFLIPTDGGNTISLKELKGNKVILYFYPKNMTPGCTTEACSFRDAYPDFSMIDAKINASYGLPKGNPGSRSAHKYASFPSISRYALFSIDN